MMEVLHSGAALRVIEKELPSGAPSSLVGSIKGGRFRERKKALAVLGRLTQEGTMQQMREAFPWDHGCRYFLRDRDAIYGGDLVALSKGLGMEELIAAPPSPWQKSVCRAADRLRTARMLVGGLHHRYWRHAA